MARDKQPILTTVLIVYLACLLVWVIVERMAG